MSSLTSLTKYISLVLCCVLFKLWKIEQIPTNMTSRAVLLFIFVDRKMIQSIQNDVMFVGIRSILHSLVLL